MREDFEKWYVETYMAMMVGAEAAIYDLRNGDGYDNDHIDGAWQAYKMRRVWADHVIGFNVSFSSIFAAIFVMIFILSVCGALYWACFSPSLYSLSISLCDFCK